ncbi:MAG: Crp/Fnr family transcriptional regulator [Schleiferiaceae bacterium]|nr:Crp/Fnr family transcriptional regulator [Schleiferiaceae bacterium]
MMTKDLPSLNCSNCVKREFSAFHDLDSSTLAEMSDVKTCAFFKKGQIMMHEGSRPNGVYCIHTGKAKLFRLGTEGKEQILRFAKEGDLIGYRALLSGEQLSASIQVLEDTHACFIPRSEMFNIIENNSKFSLEMMKMACHELGEAGRLITNLAQKTVRERLAEVLLLLNKTFGVNEEGNLDVSLTREEIANMVGTATESVIRLLSEFKDDEYIELKGRKIKILNIPALARVGQVYD